jgi:hypothetical protein
MYAYIFIYVLIYNEYVRAYMHMYTTRETFMCINIHLYVFTHLYLMYPSHDMACQDFRTICHDMMHFETLQYDI